MGRSDSQLFIDGFGARLPFLIALVRRISDAKPRANIHTRCVRLPFKQRNMFVAFW